MQGEAYPLEHYKRLFDDLESTLIQTGNRNGIADMRQQLNEYKTITEQRRDDADYYHLIVEVTFYSGFTAATVEAKLDAITEWFPDFSTVAHYGSEHVQKMMADPRMIRNESKLWACIKNARTFQEIVKEHGSFQRYVESFAPKASFKNFMMLRNDLMNRFAYLAETNSLYFLMEIGMPVLKPDLVVTRLFHRLGFIEDENISETRRFQCVEIGQKFVEATGYPIRYIDIVFVAYGQVAGNSTFQQGICLKNSPRCHICRVSEFCDYFKGTLKLKALNAGSQSATPSVPQSVPAVSPIARPKVEEPMLTLPTWAGRRVFKYSGSVRTGTWIYCGTEFRNRFEVPSSQYAAMLTKFAGQDVSIGTSRTTPPKGSLGAWLMEHYAQDAMTSYIGPILIAEGYVARGSQSDRICFRS
jgi:DNA-3-methyladenine glycosylase I